MLQYAVQPFPLPSPPPPKPHPLPPQHARPSSSSTATSASFSTKPRFLTRRQSSASSTDNSSSNFSTFSAYAALPHPHAIPLSIATSFPNSSGSGSQHNSSSRSNNVNANFVLNSHSSSQHRSHPRSHSRTSHPTALPQRAPSTAPKPIPRSPYLSSPIPRYIPTPTPDTSVPPTPAPQWSPSPPSPSSSSAAQDVLSPGDLVGEGLTLGGEAIRAVPGARDAEEGEGERAAGTFEVVRKVGEGSYAVVYLVKEVLRGGEGESGDGESLVGSLELDGVGKEGGREYGRCFAVKCLSKANLDREALGAQMNEVTIHQSLPIHPNIVTLHRTLETSSYLLLLLEFVPGEDLFYFLEQARDHYEPDEPEFEFDSFPSQEDGDAGKTRTPPTPGLLSNLGATHLLSLTRLKLVASMFAQMCDAVSACHASGVYHRDIKPENFIVTDGRNDKGERRVLVKLTDFGLSTTERESADMDCGSAPYMSFECRNNVAPTYSPRGADVWSLGIVLINMLYHYNPWTDTTEGACASFQLFRQAPVNFLLQRFTGMTPPVAEFLASRVFCVLEDPQDDSPRVEAGEFGLWAKNLPELFGVAGSREAGEQRQRHSRVVSIGSVQGFSLASVPRSRRPSSRQASLTGQGQQPGGRTHSRAPSLGLLPSPLEVEVGPPVGAGAGAETLPTVLDLDDEPSLEHELSHELEETASRSTSNAKKRRRGMRKGKGGGSASAVQSPLSPMGPPPTNDLLAETLATASQQLARELSRTSKTEAAVPAVSKKGSKWKLSFGKTSAPVTPVEETGGGGGGEDGMSATASNVTSLIMGLEAVPHDHPVPVQQDPYARGRRPAPTPNSRGPAAAASNSNVSVDRWQRGTSPTSTRSGRPLASSASSTSTASSNWRSSMVSAGSASSSAFTRYSNSSARSVSTVATSVSSGSWRNPQPPPSNVKIMNGVPWELDQLPRQLHPNPNAATGDIFGSPPPRKNRTRKPKNPNSLDTISERPGHLSRPTHHNHIQDASTSTTDLGGYGEGSWRDGGEAGEGGGGSPKKVQKGQINALAKMLSALRR